MVSKQSSFCPYNVGESFSFDRRVEIKSLQVEPQREKEGKWGREGEAEEEGFCQDFINTYIEWNNYARIKTKENFPELVWALQASKRKRERDQSPQSLGLQ